MILCWLGLAPDGLAALQGGDSPGSTTTSATPETSGDETTKDTATTAGEPVHPSIYDEVEVRERVDEQVGIAETSSEGSTGREALAARPIQRAGEVVETVPGLIATQHSGDGKANQYFIRGLNLDHGTDFSFTVAAIPVNMPSHGHGQGYADLNFVIPETIERVHFHKGTSSAEMGDFSAAGTARIDLVSTLPRPFASVTSGSGSYRRAVAAGSRTLGQGSLLAAVELHTNDGPWERPDDYRRFNGLVRYTRGDFIHGWSLTAMGYDGSWLSTDQIPERAVEEGLIGRFGLIDPGPRGDTSRYSLSGQYRRGDERSYTLAEVYALRYTFGLISNFTYFLEDPERGDQLEQDDQRWVGGLHASHLRSASLGGRKVEWTTGLQVRYDDIDNGLFHTRDLERFATTRRDAIAQWGAGVYSELEVSWTDAFRSTFGLRVDSYDARVTSDLAANSGSADDVLVSPKLALAWRPRTDTEVYASYGYGFHSNDARGATIRVDPVTGEPARPVEPLVRATGGELGVRFSPVRGLQSTLTAFSLDLASELVFVGDGGVTEASRASRRLGVEWTNAWQVRPWLTMDLDAAWVDARFTEDAPEGDEIPGALESVVTGGLAAERGRWSGALRMRSFSGYPLIEEGSVRAGATVVVNGRVAFALSDAWTVSLEGFNLLDRQDSDIEYYYTSRLPGEPAGGVDDVHFHPIEKPAVRIGLSVGL